MADGGSGGVRLEARLSATSAAAAAKPGAAAGALAALEGSRPLQAPPPPSVGCSSCCSTCCSAFIPTSSPLQALLDHAVRAEEARARLRAATLPAAAAAAATATTAGLAAHVWRQLALSPAARRWSAELSAAAAPANEGDEPPLVSLEVAAASATHTSRYASPLGVSPPQQQLGAGGGVESERGGGEGGGVAAVVIDLDQLDAAAARAAADASSTPTGIVHRTPLARLLAALPCPAYAASALATADAVRSLSALQLTEANLSAVFTPNSLGLSDPSGAGAAPCADEPATATPTDEGFWRRVVTAAGCDGAPSSVVLLSGSDTVRAAAAAAGVAVGPLPINSPEYPPDRALLAAMGCCTARAADAAARAAYLTAKVPVDQQAISAEVAAKLQAQLAEVRSQAAAEAGGGAAPAGGPLLRVTDVGAGGLSMLPRLAALAAAAGYGALEYLALESDRELLEAAAARLTADGFKLLSGSDGAVDGAEAAAALGGTLRAEGWGGIPGAVTLRCRAVDALDAADAADAAAEGDASKARALGLPVERPQLLVACGFADLLPPRALLALLAKLCPGGLGYLPITFAGTTRLVPAFAGCGHLPADQAVMDAYHRHLEENEGQFLDVPQLIATAASAGAALVAWGPSPWIIPPEAPFHPYMLDFLGAGTAAALWSDGHDAAGWLAHARARRATVEVENLDLLLRLPQGCKPVAASYEGLEFLAPRRVQVVPRAAPLASGGGGGVLAEGLAELRTVVSMVSSGTELLVWRGDFDTTDEPLDATIAGLKDDGLAYPLAYGYSLVGEVVAVGRGAPASLVGRTCFAFAPHAAAAFFPAAGLMAVPADVSAADAAFLPAAETAVSLVHDAHPRLGETVAVFGQGVIGLLVTAACAAMGLRVHAVDLDARRRRLAERLGAAVASGPEGAPRRAADVAIECSGSPRALQAAIDAAVDHGTVVIASWYGRKPVALSLGTRFHRSHLKLVASQVSHIPGGIGDTWSKARRFGAAWELIRKVRPATALGSITLPLRRAAEGYAMLDEAKAVVVMLSYDEEVIRTPRSSFTAESEAADA